MSLFNDCLASVIIGDTSYMRNVPCGTKGSKSLSGIGWTIVSCKEGRYTHECKCSQEMLNYMSADSACSGEAQIKLENVSTETWRNEKEIKEQCVACLPRFIGKEAMRVDSITGKRVRHGSAMEVGVNESSSCRSWNVKQFVQGTR